ncbi:hypothetical protein AAF712_005657 [Marasmius tenuissimus]|uniref:Uncharacterized protein n=1 Tax=Marasmius tenuissimus TaxID=585030 RepID=A0ABR3A1N2_9AGAR
MSPLWNVLKASEDAYLQHSNSAADSREPKPTVHTPHIPIAIPRKDNAPRHDLLIRFVEMVSSRQLDQKPLFLDLTQVVIDIAEHEAKGKGLQNITHPPALNDWCHELACICPESYCLFQSTFGGCSERSFQKKRSEAPKFQQGITEQVKTMTERYLSSYGYSKDRPLAFAVDDTKLLTAFRPFYDTQKEKWFVIGGSGVALEVPDINHLDQQLEEAKSTKASKVRLWTLQIPLNHVPPGIMAVAQIGSSNSAAELGVMESEILDFLLDPQHGLHINIISLGSDGTVVERDARRELLKSKYARVLYHCIPHPQPSNGTIDIKIYCIHGRSMAVIQDSKHCRKTLRNNILSGAHFLVLGSHYICYEQIRNIALDTNFSPLYKRNMEKIDHQDDRAAARLFSASTLEYVLEQMPDSLALAIFLFVFGELIDAYQSRTVTHHERAKMVFRARFFKALWKQFLARAGYSQARFFISREADDITDIIINGLLSLQVIHRDHLNIPTPLLPWIHGTKMCEHVFGFMRQLIPDFTILDALRAIPKLAVRLQAACARKHIPKDFRRVASGYSHTYFAAEDADMKSLGEYPSDSEYISLSEIAYEEALFLWEILGYVPEATEIPFDKALGSPSSKVEVDPGDIDEVDIELQEPSDCQQLQEALDMASKAQLPFSSKADAVIDECTFAAAALDFHELEKITSLPDDDPESLIILQAHIFAALNGIASFGPQAAYSFGTGSATVSVNDHQS